MAKRTEPEDRGAQQWAGTVRLEVLECRQFGHLWVSGMRTLYKWNGHYIREVGCGRCQMIRRDLIPIGEYGQIRRQYFPPEDYRREPGPEGSTKVPRWVIADAVVAKAKVHEAPPDILDWASRGRS